MGFPDNRQREIERKNARIGAVFLLIMSVAYSIIAALPRTPETPSVIFGFSAALAFSVGALLWIINRP